MPGKLTYFDLGGRAEAIRAMLKHANFEYEDDRVSILQFNKIKKDPTILPFAVMPVWVEDNFTTI